MAKTIHSFKTAQGTTYTRESASRLYRACLVATVTAGTLDHLAAFAREAEAELAACEAKLAELLASRGTTVEAATAIHEAESDSPAGGRGYNCARWDMEDAIRAELGITDTWTRRHEIQDLARARLAEQGILDPYRKGGPGDVVEAARHVDFWRHSLERRIARAASLSVGDQEVLSWHSTTQNAQKATGSRDATARTQFGWSVSVRTDITTRERATRARRA